ECERSQEQEEGEAERFISAEHLREGVDPGGSGADDIHGCPDEGADGSESRNERGGRQAHLFRGAQPWRSQDGEAREKDSNGKQRRPSPNGEAAPLASGKSAKADDTLCKGGSRPRERKILDFLEQTRALIDGLAADAAKAYVLSRIRGHQRLCSDRKCLRVNRIDRSRAKTQKNSPASLSFNTALARKSLFLTVPRGIRFT